jgi:hypothetical protein
MKTLRVSITALMVGQKVRCPTFSTYILWVFCTTNTEYIKLKIIAMLLCCLAPSYESTQFYYHILLWNLTNTTTRMNAYRYECSSFLPLPAVRDGMNCTYGISEIPNCVHAICNDCNLVQGRPMTSLMIIIGAYFQIAGKAHTSVISQLMAFQISLSIERT